MKNISTRKENWNESVGDDSPERTQIYKILPIFSKERMKLNSHSLPKKNPSKPWCQKDVKKKRCKKDVKIYYCYYYY